MYQPLKVVMAHDHQGLPDWWESQLANYNISFEVSREPWSADELIRRASGADVIIQLVSRHLLTAETIAALDTCWAILTLASGVDTINVNAATAKNILVANTPDALTESMADGTITLLFSLVKQVPLLDKMVRIGDWHHQSSRAFRPITGFRGATLGLVGFGRIGRAVAQKLSGFGMDILAYDPYADAYALAAQRVRHVGLTELLQQSDFVCLTCPLTEETYHLISEPELRLMKPDAVLVNTGRGPVVDEAALYRALTEGWIARAGLDVNEQEPVAPDNPLLQLDNVILTGHSVGNSNAPDGRWSEAAEVLRALALGRWPRSVVNRGWITPQRPLR